MIVLDNKPIVLNEGIEHYEGKYLFKDPRGRKWTFIDKKMIKTLTDDEVDTIYSVVCACISDAKKTLKSCAKYLDTKTIYFVDQACPSFKNLKTMATDGVSIFLTIPFCYKHIIQKSEPIVIQFGIIHEIFHIVFDHVRQEETMKTETRFNNHEKVNIAQDYEINYIIVNYLHDVEGDLPFKVLYDDDLNVITDSKGQPVNVCDLYHFYYSEEYAKKRLLWDMIYPLLNNENENKEDKYPMSTSDDFKRGFLDAYNFTMQEYRNQNLIEHYEI